MLAVADDARAGRAVRRARLAERRRTLGLTQEDLAALLEIERSTVARWERGSTQPLPWLWPKLADALQVPAGQLAELLGGATPAGPDRREPAAPPVPRQLPPAAAGFTGRAAELRTLTRMLEDVGAGAPGTVVISAIGGTAGVGKTALALRWAHQIAGRFPDGQLHVNLRGFDPAGPPATPAQAIRGFLDALGVPPERIPPRPEAQAGLYRSLLADRRMLILLDNARDEQQVRPLLSASPGSLVLVTSRNQLSGLAAADGARLLSLDTLSHDEAVHLLAARLGEARAAAEPEVVAEIARLCGYLPLALTVAAARAAARPGFPLAGLAAELRDAAGRLDALDIGDPAGSVQAAFSWSYRQLSTEAAGMFRLLGLHPGPDISAPAAASLAATHEPGARRRLRELTRGYLIAEHVPGRYTVHDLLRAYAAAQARDCDGEAERQAATGRVLDHYLHTAYAAALELHPSREPISLSPAAPGSAPERIGGYQQAMAWLGAEHQVLLGAVTFAAESGFDGHAWRIGLALWDFLDRRGHLHQLVPIQGIALAAATRLGDVAGQAMSSRLLAMSYATLGDFDQVLGHYQNALGLYRQAGNRLGEAKVHQGLAYVAERQGRYTDALGHSEQALGLFHALGDRAAEAETLNDVGWCHGLLGDYQQARAFCRRSLALSAEAGLREYEPHVWDSLGYTEHHLGNVAEAAACYQRALGLCRELGDRRFEATILTHLGDTWDAAGELPQARTAWQQALAILEDLDHPDAGRVRAKLDGADIARK
jgi:tetratricopeptide (TPR) repeat protein/transcriptional regulator with XRE-family HTH domain